MSQGDQISDCFLFDLEPNLAAIPIAHSHRKPSYDDILADFPPTLQHSLEVTIQPSPISHSSRRGKQALVGGSGERKERKRRENVKTLGEGQHRGHWQAEESKRYHWFLELHSAHFLNKHMRRMDKIFKGMERFVATREAEQCRSHHQKMEKKHGSFLAILKQLRRQNYGCGDAELIADDMLANGVQCSEQLLSWAFLEEGMEGTLEESEKSTVNEGSPLSFVDPMAELNCQYEAELGLLIL